LCLTDTLHLLKITPNKTTLSIIKKRDILWRSEFQYGSQTHEMLNIGPYKKKCFKDLSLEPLNH
jgi:hypothetical protein